MNARYDHLRIVDRLSKIMLGSPTANRAIDVAAGLTGAVPPYTFDEAAD